MIEIPLTTDPEQLFRCAVNGVPYNWRVLYNARAECWAIDLRDENENLLVADVRILGGVDLFQQYPDIPLKNVYYISQLTPWQDPTATNLGTTARLYVLTEAEVAEVFSG